MVFGDLKCDLQKVSEFCSNNKPLKFIWESSESKRPVDYLGILVIVQLSTLVDLDSQLDWHKFKYGLIELHIFCA